MKPEYTRREQCIRYAEHLQERLQSGLLSELQPLSQWVVWRQQEEDGKQKKVPYTPHLHLKRASVKNPESWGTLQQALQALKTGNYSGLGFMIVPPLVMVDLDHSYNQQTREITSPQAAAIIQALNSYTEASPRDGLHGLVYAEQPVKNVRSQGIEVYGQERFTTITTNHIVGTPRTIEHRQDVLDALFKQFVPPVPEQEVQNTWLVGSGAALTELPPEAANDVQLQRLLAGDMSSYGNDHSRADFVLILKLLHWTGDNTALTREIFLASPLGQRAKATRKSGETTYLDKTIRNAQERRRNPPQRR